MVRFVIDRDCAQNIRELSIHEYIHRASPLSYIVCDSTDMHFTYYYLENETLPAIPRQSRSEEFNDAGLPEPKRV